MRTVHKFFVPHNSPAAAELPPMPIRRSAPVRLAGLDPRSGQPAVWIEVETTAPAGERRMVAFGTGDELPDGWVHVGSLIDGSFVWHIYEEPLL